MAKKKKENGKEEIQDDSPDLSVSDSVFNRSQIKVDKSTTNITNINYGSPQDTAKKEFKCPACYKVFTKQHSMLQHYRDVCGSKSSDDANLELDEEYNNKIDDDEDVTDSLPPVCMECGDSTELVEDDELKDVSFDVFTCYQCNYLCDENGELIYLEEPEEPEEPEEIEGEYKQLLRVLMRDYEGEPRVAQRVVTHHVFAGPLFAIIYVFFSGEIYNLFSAQIYEWTYWAGMTFPFFILLGIINIVNVSSEEQFMNSLVLVLVGPFIIALASIIGNSYGIFWLLFFALIFSIFVFSLYELDNSFKISSDEIILTIILVAVAEFFIVFEDTFRGVGTFFVTTLDGFLPSVIKYELVYALFSIGLVFVVISPSFYYAETSSEHGHYLSHGIVLGLLFFLIEFFVYPISDSVVVAIISAMFLTFISFQSTKMFFDYD